MFRAAAFALSVLLWMASAAHAESGMPTDIEWRLAELGAVADSTETAHLYAPLQETAPYRGIKVTRDIKYGPHERHALDVFALEPSAAARPVLIFVHGGAFVAGNKRVGNSPFYDNIALFAARNGMIGVNVTYRLAPAHPWPAGAEDMCRAMHWVGESIAAQGGDTARVYLMGHSAGAVHVAGYVAHSQFHGPRGIGLAGAILVSGIYDLTAMSPGSMGKAYFGEDASKYAARSPLLGLIKAPIRLLVAYAELDPDVFQEQAKRLNDALCKVGRCPTAVVLEKHSHTSEVYAINTRDRSLTDPILAFAEGRK
jgi:acetyl esterase/lipase